MNNLLTWIKDNPIRSMFLIPIFLVAGISISHVVAWYDITNPISWAIYLSIAIEIGAITALIAATQRIKGGVWFMFGLVTFVQMIGNIFYSYKEINPDGELFVAWVELTSPIFEIFGTEPTDIVAHKRWLAILGGGLLPVISLTSLHFFVKYEKSEKLIPENDRDLEIASLMDFETFIKEEEKEIEKPIPKRGRKKKEFTGKWENSGILNDLKPMDEKSPIITILESNETQVIDESNLENVEESVTEKNEEIKEEPKIENVESEIRNIVPPSRPNRLTYTKPNVTIDRPK